MVVITPILANEDEIRVDMVCVTAIPDHPGVPPHRDGAGHRFPLGALRHLKFGRAPALPRGSLTVVDGVVGGFDDRLMQLVDAFAGKQWQNDFAIASGRPECAP